jgi:hypothetical protein
MDRCNTSCSKRFRSVEIDHEIKPRRLHNQQVRAFNEIEVPLYFVGVWVREF